MLTAALQMRTDCMKSGDVYAAIPRFLEIDMRRMRTVEDKVAAMTLEDKVAELGKWADETKMHNSQPINIMGTRRGRVHSPNWMW